MDADAVSSATQYSSVFVMGVAPVDARLIFHFAVTADAFVRSATGNRTVSYFQLLLYSDIDAANQWGKTSAVLSEVHSDRNATSTLDGVDLSLQLGAFSGAYDYFFESYVMVIVSPTQQRDAEATSNLSARLLGIDAVDGDGAVLASASFDQTGVAALNLDPTLAPEPASVVLLATGLLGLAGVVRRRTGLLRDAGHRGLFR